MPGQVKAKELDHIQIISLKKFSGGGGGGGGGGVVVCLIIVSLLALVCEKSNVRYTIISL